MARRAAATKAKRTGGQRLRTQPHRDLLLSNPAILFDLAQRGLVRVNAYKIADAANVSHQTVERWLTGVSVRPETDRALRRVCGLDEVA